MEGPLMDANDYLFRLIGVRSSTFSTEYVHKLWINLLQGPYLGRLSGSELRLLKNWAVTFI